jgi:hypothetical protein
MSGVRDTSFLQNSINKNKGKGINMPKHLIDEVVKQHKQDESIKNKQPVSSTVDDVELLKLAHEKEIAKLKSKILEESEARKRAESGEKRLTKNEEKLLAAIRSEMIIQKTNNPIIGRTKLLKEYQINARYFDDAINGLTSKNLIKRKPVKYSAKITTFSWKLIS